MLTAYIVEGRNLRRLPQPVQLSALRTAVWIDLLSPTPEESALVEDVTGLQVAARADLEEIESSSRLSYEDEALYLSLPLVTRTDTLDPITSPIGFALSPDHLLTIRFTESRVIEHLADRGPHEQPIGDGAVNVFAIVLEALVDRLADILERINADLDGISRRIFQESADQRMRRANVTLHDALKAIGLAGDLVSRIRESLLGIGRIVPYAEQMAPWIPAKLRPRLTTLRQDNTSLSDYAGHLSNKIQFLLDATLGLIGVAQNNIIKILTVVSVVGVPPTLVASIYGMNFKYIPELNWSFGYWYGLTAIALSAIVPFIVFRLRGWL